MWHLLQIVIVYAVMASNFHWQWTPNPYIAGLLAVVAAFAVTALLGDLIRWARRLLTLVPPTVFESPRAFLSPANGKLRGQVETRFFFVKSLSLKTNPRAFLTQQWVSVAQTPAFAVSYSSVVYKAV